MSRESRRRSYQRKLEGEYLRKTESAWNTFLDERTSNPDTPEAVRLAARDRYYTMVDQAVRNLEQGTAQADFILDLQEGAKQ